MEISRQYNLMGKVLQVIGWFLMALASGKVYADSKQAIQPLVIHAHKQQDSLHLIVFWICLIVFAVALGLTFYSIFKQRQLGAPDAGHFHESILVEIIWTLIPFIILVGMAYPASKTIFDAAYPDTAILPIQITGHRWGWDYFYPRQGIHVSSRLVSVCEGQAVDSQSCPGLSYKAVLPIFVPAGQLVRLRLVSNPVITAWYWTKPGIPQSSGLIRTVWFKAGPPGLFQDTQAQLCDSYHGCLAVPVRVVGRHHFKVWVESFKQVSKVLP
ncbi:MAG: cytochrome c oxidase subunit II [Proteobacteria bacterium]|nr:cytochrome c oxidase subunit II [Pseudomonadota bacterium]MDE3207856.1 cytochrome c oxidase subunit II [Pseudomonadota bacterium]